MRYIPILVGLLCQPLLAMQQTEKQTLKALTQFHTTNPLPKAKKFRKTIKDLGKPIVTNKIKSGQTFEESSDEDTHHTSYRRPKYKYTIASAAVFATGLYSVINIHAEEKSSYPDLKPVEEHQVGIDNGTTKPSGEHKPQSGGNVAGYVMAGVVAIKAVGEGIKQIFGKNKPQQEPVPEPTIQKTIGQELMEAEEQWRKEREEQARKDQGPTYRELKSQERGKKSALSLGEQPPQQPDPIEPSKKDHELVLKTPSQNGNPQEKPDTPFSFQQEVFKSMAKSLGGAAGDLSFYIGKRVVDDVYPVISEQVAKGANKIRTEIYSKYFSDTYNPSLQGKRMDEAKMHVRAITAIREAESSVTDLVKHKYALDTLNNELKKDFRHINETTGELEVDPDTVLELWRTQNPAVPIDSRFNVINVEGKLKKVTVDTVSHQFKYEELKEKDIQELYKAHSIGVISEFDERVEQEYKKYEEYKNPYNFETIHNTAKTCTKAALGIAATGGKWALNVGTLGGLPLYEYMTGTNMRAAVDRGISHTVDYVMGENSEYKVPSSGSDNDFQGYLIGVKMMPMDTLHRQEIPHELLIDIAKSRGYTICSCHAINTNEFVFSKKLKDGSLKYITYDRQGDSGGFWKVYGGKNGHQRIGTYQKNLKRKV